MRHLLAAILVLPFLGQVARAHEGHEHVLGTVSAVDASHVEVKSKDGKTVSVRLTSDTKYWKGTAPAAPADLKVGMRVEIHAAPKADVLEAEEIRLGSLPKTDAKPSPHP